jgi:hypothetical protein
MCNLSRVAALSDGDFQATAPTKRIPLTQAKVAIVDPDDYDRPSKHKWQANKDHSKLFCARRSKILTGGRQRYPCTARCALLRLD